VLRVVELLVCLGLGDGWAAKAPVIAMQKAIARMLRFFTG
jgi:hypothetical protein